MMMWAAHGMPCPVGLATWCVVCSVAPSCRVIAPATAPMSGSPCGSAATCLHVLHVMITPSSCTSCRRLSNARTFIGNTWAPLHTRCNQSFLYPHVPRHTEYYVGRVLALEPSCTGRRGSEPYDTRWHRRPFLRRSEIWSRGTHDSGDVSEVAWSGATGRVTALRCASYPFSWLEA
jgi:hypothetical protein